MGEIDYILLIPHPEYTESGVTAHEGYVLKWCRVCGEPVQLGRSQARNYDTCGRSKCDNVQEMGVRA